jgi:hypothetical protein
MHSRCAAIVTGSTHRQAGHRKLASGTSARTAGPPVCLSGSRKGRDEIDCVWKTLDFLMHEWVGPLLKADEVESNGKGEIEYPCPMCGGRHVLTAAAITPHGSGSPQAIHPSFIG